MNSSYDNNFVPDITIDSFKSMFKINSDYHGISNEVETFLKDKDYVLVHELGEGKTRKSFLAQYNSGEVSSLRVVKIPLDMIDESSICTIINTSKRDLEENEAHISNMLHYPNLIDVLENFKVPNTNKTINVEAYFNAQDLESLVNGSGNINDEHKFRNIFTQVIDAVTYANYVNTEKYKFDDGVLLRDIKPSNILVNKDGLVKITDLQNAETIDKIIELNLPTRGGTAYTHPSLINALVTNKPAKATRQTDMYAVAASMYFALTGENAFNYNIVEVGKEEKGNLITIRNKEYKVKLQIDGTNIDEITEKEHELRLKKSLKNKKIPFKYKKLLYNGLTLNQKKAYKNIHKLKNDFKKLAKPSLDQFLSKAYSSLKPMLITAVGVAVAGGFLNMAIWQSKQKEPKPTMQEILRWDDYRNFSNVALHGDSTRIYDLLKPVFQKVSSEVPKFSKQNKLNFMRDDSTSLEQISLLTSNIHYVDKRLSAAVVASILINGVSKEYVNETYGVDKNGKPNRLAPAYAPMNFIFKNNRFGSPLVEENSFGYLGLYLKASMVRCDKAEDVFVNFFSDDEEVKSAIIRTGSVDYFPKVTSGGIVTSGYGSFLPSNKRDLINTAVAVYMLTDKDGQIDLNKIPKKVDVYK